MATGILYRIQNWWPFSVFKYDDLKASDRIVRKLSIPESTKPFIFVIREPESQSMIYVLCVQKLSVRSVEDAECLIRAIKPDAVVAQVGRLTIDEIQSEEVEFQNNDEYAVPTSSFEVLKRCFLLKENKAKYEFMAENLVFREIFGIGFHGNLLAAKRLAKEVGSSFLLIESPCLKTIGDSKCSGEADSRNKVQPLGLQPNSLVPHRSMSSVPLSSSRYVLSNDIRAQMVKKLSSYLVNIDSSLEVCSGDILPREDYVAPQFAESLYPLLVDLHDIFQDIKSIGRALAHAQKLLYDIIRGEIVDALHLSDLYVFRVAVEGLRIALTNAGRHPIDKLHDFNSDKSEFSDLSVEEKSHALLAQALRSQSKRYKSIVAIVEASSLGGLRKHFNTSVPLEVKNLVEELVIEYTDDEDSSKHHRLGSLMGKPMVAVGAGATAVLGASSISKVVPVSNFIKFVSFKTPSSLKLAMTLTQKAMTLAFGKSVGPSNVFAHGFASSSVKTTSAMKGLASAEKFRNVAHSVIASAEKTSLSAMRTAFYEIMRKRRIRPVGFLPWATFGCSMATCTALLVCGDGIECAAESLPAAPSIAKLGRGIQSLHQASQAVRQTESLKIQKSIESLLNSFR